MNEPASRRAADPISDVLGDLAARFGRDRDAGGLSTGDHAELRRMDAAAGVLPPALWRLLARNDVAAAIGSFPRAAEAVERAFAVVVQAAAETGGGGLPIGAALAQTGYAEPRFVRFLRARGLQAVAREAGLVARWCAAQGVQPRFSDRYPGDGFGPFIVAAALGQAYADHRAHAIARDYFNAEARARRADAPSTDPAP